jgi:hypothetical protein
VQEAKQDTKILTNQKMKAQEVQERLGAENEELLQKVQDSAKKAAVLDTRAGEDAATKAQLAEQLAALQESNTDLQEQAESAQAHFTQALQTVSDLKVEHISEMGEKKVEVAKLQVRLEVRLSHCIKALLSLSVSDICMLSEFTQLKGGTPDGESAGRLTRW